MPATDKPCVKCSILLTITKKGQTYCKTCTKAYRQNNKQKIKEYLDKYREDTRDRNIEYQREYRERHHTELLEKKRLKYIRDHPDMKPPSKYGKVTEHPDYVIWSNMNRRCHNPKDSSYGYYGGRGIQVHGRWRESFDNFMDDMGPRPEPRHLYSIDRYPDKDGNYEPGNVRWATSEEQANNRRARDTSHLDILDSNEVIHPDGLSVTLLELSKLTKIPLDVVKYRYKKKSDFTWICESNTDGRLFEYNGLKYNARELRVMSGQSLALLYHRLVKLKWSVHDAMFTPP